MNVAKLLDSSALCCKSYFIKPDAEFYNMSCLNTHTIAL